MLTHALLVAQVLWQLQALQHARIVRQLHTPQLRLHHALPVTQGTVHRVQELLVLTPQRVQFVQLAIPARVALAEQWGRMDARCARRTHSRNLVMERRVLVKPDMARLMEAPRALHAHKALTSPQLATRPAPCVLLDTLERPLVPHL